MFLRTHLAFNIALILIFLPVINDKLIFVSVALLATLLVDIDTAHSHLGNSPIFRPLQFFVKHRGIIHSFTIGIIISILLALFYPVFALPFFLGYGGHILFDSLTVDGIRPFWPFKAELKGRINTGRTTEKTLFLVLAVLDIFLAVRLFL